MYDKKKYEQSLSFYNIFITLFIIDYIPQSSVRILTGSTC